MYDWINQKTIAGKIYTAYRNDERKQFVECEGVFVECRLKDVWNDTSKLLSLFK